MPLCYKLLISIKYISPYALYTLQGRRKRFLIKRDFERYFPFSDKRKKTLNLISIQKYRIIFYDPYYKPLLIKIL